MKQALTLVAVAALAVAALAAATPRQRETAWVPGVVVGIEQNPGRAAVQGRSNNYVIHTPAADYTLQDVHWKSNMANGLIFKTGKPIESPYTVGQAVLLQVKPNRKHAILKVGDTEKQYRIITISASHAHK